MPQLNAEEYKPFEQIRRSRPEGGAEYWSARELAEVLGYTQWRNFQKAIDRAIVACEKAGQEVAAHFAETVIMAEIGSSTFRKIPDYELSRYACYLIVQNADPHKEVVALGQTYFAIQTRRAEVQDAFNGLDENAKRLVARGNVKQWNQLLANAARRAGVLSDEDFLVFTNAGYMGLYGGLDVSDIHSRKNLAEDEKILDFMGSTELIANLFRISQTEEILRTSDVSTPEQAANTHFEVADKIRRALIEMGATMPEDLPKAADIHTIELSAIESLKGRELMADE